MSDLWKEEKKIDGVVHVVGGRKETKAQEMMLNYVCLSVSSLPAAFLILSCTF